LGVLQDGIIKKKQVSPENCSNLEIHKFSKVVLRKRFNVSF